MDSKYYFFHDIKGQNGEIVKKGIAVKNSFEDAKQSYHAYLGAYAYGHEEVTDFVSVFISDMDGRVVMSETWRKEMNEDGDGNGIGNN